MAKKSYIGVSNLAHKIKKGYFGVSNLARKIKKAYIGVGGVARPCWSGGELAYYGTATALSAARKSLSATSVGDYALFGAGNYTTVDAYNKSLTRSTPTASSSARQYGAATSVGNYALFAGGYNVSSVDAYNKSLTRSTPTALSSARQYAAATTVGNYALFAGGSNQIKSVDAYNASLVRSTATDLNNTSYDFAGTTVGGYALFAGGHEAVYNTSGNVLNVVNAYTASLVKSTPTVMSVARKSLAATTVGDYALFGGGRTTTSGTTATTVVDAYNKSLVRSTPTALNSRTIEPNATTVGDYALFGGGFIYGSSGYPSAQSTMTAYDASLVKSTPTALSVARYGMGATSIGDYALFGGGTTSSFNGYESAVVDAYVVA